MQLLLAAAMLPALGQAQTGGVSVPLMLAPDSERQGFVRIINETDQAGSVRITAVDDAGNAASPFSIELPAGASVHFNSDDLADGNSAKGIRGIGQPQQDHWRLRVEAAEGVRVMAFVRTRAGFLTAMHDVLPRDGQGRIVAWMLNPGSNRIQESSLRLVNTGTNSERVSIRGTDDRSRSAGPVTLTLPAGQARTISAFDLENGAQGLIGSLGDGGGKWRLTIEAGQSVMGMGLLETPAGPITNISTIGVPPMVRAPSEPPTDPEPPGGQGNSFANAINLAVGGRVSGSIDPAGESDYYRIRVSQSGTLDVYTSGSLDTRGYLHDSGERQLASNDDGGTSDGLNFRISREVDAGTYYARVEAYYRDATGSYTVHAELDASTEPEPPIDPNPPTDPEPPEDDTIYGSFYFGFSRAWYESIDGRDPAVRFYRDDNGEMYAIGRSARTATTSLFDDWDFPYAGENDPDNNYRGPTSSARAQIVTRDACRRDSRTWECVHYLNWNSDQCFVLSSSSNFYGEGKTYTFKVTPRSRANTTLREMGRAAVNLCEEVIRAAEERGNPAYSNECEPPITEWTVCEEDGRWRKRFP